MSLTASSAHAATIDIINPWTDTPGTDRMLIDCSALNYDNPHANFTSPKGDESAWITMPAQAQSVMDQCDAAEHPGKVLAATTVAPTVLPKTGSSLPLGLLTASIVSLLVLVLRRQPLHVTREQYRFLDAI
jgi:hypothetical protein